MKIPLLLALFLFPIFSCGNDSKSNQAPAATAPFEAEAGLAPTYLEGIYATSTAPGSSVQNLFDGNPGTIWQTRAGAGPDEGIMLYFQNAQLLDAIEVQANTGSFTEKGMLEIYGNGAIVAQGKPNSSIPLQSKLIKSLFIHIQNTGKESRETINDVEIDTYPDDAAVAISEIVLRDDKGQTMRIVPPKMIKGTAIASSTLNPEAAYSTANLFDGRKEFAWVEGNSATAGVGEVIKFSINDPSVTISAIQIWNGYQRSDEHFESNARLRDFEVEASGAVPNTYTLRDTKGGQRIELATPIKTGNITLLTKSIYPGKLYKDMGISEIVFFEGKAPLQLQTDIPKKFEADIIQKTKGSPLAKLLNHRIFNRMNPDGSTLFQQSLILRSDGTFVVYSSSSDPNDETGTAEQKSYADGNWELLSADAQQARVKIFGRWTDESNLADYYKGLARQAFTRIFSDVLTIEKNQLSGSKILGDYYFK